MNNTHPFDLTLASPPINWPVVTRDGRKATLLTFDAPGKFPIVGYIHDGNYIDAASWFPAGTFSEPAKDPQNDDILLNLDLASPEVGAAVERCHKEGMEIIWRYRSDSGWDTSHSSLITQPIWNWGSYEYIPRVLLPESERNPIAPGHNPDKLTVAQVGEGWRLLDEDELVKDGAWQKAIEKWIDNEAWDDTGWIGIEKSYTFRTRLTRAELAALRNPKPAWQMPTPPEGRESKEWALFLIENATEMLKRIDKTQPVG